MGTEVSEPTKFGRYLEIEITGRGAAGACVRAYDVLLQREVALQRVEGPAVSAEEQALLLRQAQAMAKLSHPNLIAVYDATMSDDQHALVVAMEFVGGQTLARWLEQGRSWREVLEVFIAAGRGLCAAHAVGLYHREFGMEHVLIGDDGRVRVATFGQLRKSDDDALAALDAQRDFCVALWEALVEQASSGSHASRSSPAIGDPRSWPRGLLVPRSIIDALVRGTAEPNQRWPSMDALLHALAFAPRHRGRKRLLVGGSVMLAVALLGGAWASWHRARASLCSGGRERITSAWNDARRSAIARAVLGTGHDYTADVWARVEPELRAYASRWVDAHTDACEATTIRGAQSPAIMDLRMACLHRAKQQLAAVADVLGDADTQVVLKAHRLVASLPKLERCADVDALQSDVSPPDSAQAAAVEAMRDDLGRAAALSRSGRAPKAVEQLEALLEQARTLAYTPLQTEILLVLGEAKESAGAYGEAAAAFRQALQLGMRARQTGVAAAAARSLVRTVGYFEARAAEGMAYANTGQALARLDDLQARAELQHALGTVYMTLGRFAEAEKAMRAALQAWERELGPEHHTVASARSSLGTALVSLGRFAEAAAEHRAGLAILERALGPTHPDAAISRNNLGATLEAQGHLTEAAHEYEAALSIWENAFGSEHSHVAVARYNLGFVKMTAGDFAGAQVHQEAALSIWKKTYGAKHPDVASAHNDLGNTLCAQGDYARGETHLREALSIWTETLGAGHPLVARSWYGLAKARLDRGRAAQAQEHARTAVEILEAALGAEHVEVATARDLHGEALQALGDHARAEAEHRAALVVRVKLLGEEHPHVAASHGNLGRLFAATGRFAQAEAAHRSAVRILEKVHGARHPKVATAKQQLAQLLKRTR